MDHGATCDCGARAGIYLDCARRGGDTISCHDRVTRRIRTARNALGATRSPVDPCGCAHGTNALSRESAITPRPGSQPGDMTLAIPEKRGAPARDLAPEPAKVSAS